MGSEWEKNRAARFNESQSRQTISATTAASTETICRQASWRQTIVWDWKRWNPRTSEVVSTLVFSPCPRRRQCRISAYFIIQRQISFSSSPKVVLPSLQSLFPLRWRGKGIPHLTWPTRQWTLAVYRVHVYNFRYDFICIFLNLSW